MNKIIALVVLAAFLPLQAYAASFEGFTSDTQFERFYPRTGDKPPDITEKELNEKIQAEEASSASKSGFNWYLWGGIGAAAIAVSVIVVVMGGSKGGSSAAPASTASVTGSW